MFSLGTIQRMNRESVVQSWAMKTFLFFHAADSTKVYLDLLNTLKKRTTKKLLNNTYAVRRENGRIAVRLHNTDVVTFDPNGDVMLDTGGWKTVTTKSRMNQYLPRPLRVYARNFVWYVWDGKSEVEFEDGMVLCPKSW